MSNFSSPFMFKSPLNDLRKANSSRKTKKRQPMKDCEGFECSKSEASLNRGNKTKTRTKTHIDNARSAAKDSAPLNQKYKKGDLISEDDAEVYTNLNVHELSEIKKDKKSQYITTIDNDTIRPNSNKRKFPRTKNKNEISDRKWNKIIEESRKKMPKPY